MALEARFSANYGVAAALEKRLASRQAVVGIVGLGYVGLPLANVVSQEGMRVIGVDVDPAKVDSLSAGRSYVGDVPDSQLRRFEDPVFSTDHTVLADADVVILAIPTPLRDGVPDLSLVRGAATDLAAVLRPGQLVILESTTYPGTTEELVRPILESSGLQLEEEFFLAYSPERIDPGRSRNFRETPKIVSGVGSCSIQLVELFYRQLVEQVVVTPTPRDAEMAKLIENTFRQVNIALVNELAILAPALGVDIWAAIDAAASKPFGFMPFWPGPGVGGHCIAIDPSYLSWRVDQQLGFGIRFVEHARRVNNQMPDYVVQRLASTLNEQGKPLKRSRIMGLGLAYKADVDDMRESPALAVMERLARAGADITYHDPYVQTASILGQQHCSQPLAPEFLEKQDCVVVLTTHQVVDYQLVIEHAPLVFDTRGVTYRLLDRPNVIRL